MSTQIEITKRNLRTEYFNVCDRIYLNELAKKKQTKNHPKLNEQIKKDNERKIELENFLGL